MSVSGILMASDHQGSRSMNKKVDMIDIVLIIGYFAYGIYWSFRAERAGSFQMTTSWKMKFVKLYIMMILPGCMAAFWNRNQPMYLLILFILAFSYPLMQYILWKLACERSAQIKDERKERPSARHLTRRISGHIFLRPHMACFL